MTKTKSGKGATSEKEISLAQAELSALREEALRLRKIAHANLDWQGSLIDEEAFIQNQKSGLVFITSKGEIKGATSLFSTSLGVDLKSLTGRTFAESGLFGDQDIEELENEIRTALNGVDGKPVYATMKNGDGKPVDVCVQALSAGSGEAVCVFRQAGGIRKLLSSYRKLKNRYADMVDLSPVGISVNELGTGKFLSVNEYMCDVSGYSEEEFLGMTVADVLGDPVSVSTNKARMSRTMSGDWVPLRVEYKVNAKDGRDLWVDVWVDLIYENGAPVKSKSVIIDVTDKIKAQKEKNELERQLAQRQKMETVGVLAGGVAHDFNNLLSPILGYAEMVYEDLAEGSLEKHNIGEVIQATHRAKDLVSQILTFSRKSPEKNEPVNLSLIVDEVLRFVRSSVPSNIIINKQVEKNCGPVIGDAGKIHQVVMNLCTNAYHAMRENGGEMNVELSLEEGSASGDESKAQNKNVRLVVADSGSGIDPEVMDRIFEPYFTTKKVGEGAGLGLAVTHSIVTEYGGSICVRSKPGQGASFEVRFPVTESVQVSPVEPFYTESLNGSERVLLVDDELPVLKMTKQFLEKFGYEVWPQASSRDALAVFQHRPDDFDLVITDMTMPDMTGDVLSKKILEIRPETPIVLCTGYSDQLTEEKAKKLGISEYVMKPILIHEMAATIRKVLDRA